MATDFGEIWRIFRPYLWFIEHYFIIIIIIKPTKQAQNQRLKQN